MPANPHGQATAESDSKPLTFRPADPSSVPRGPVRDGYVDIRSILAPGVFPVGRTTWCDLVATGNAPKPVKMGTRAFWRVSEIEAFLALDPSEISRRMLAARTASRGAK